MHKALTLDSFIKKEKTEESIGRERTRPTQHSADIRGYELKVLEELSEIALKIHEKSSSEMALLLGLDYNPDINKVVAKFYDLITEEIFTVVDNSGHHPYMLTDMPKEEIMKLAASHGLKESIIDIVEVEKHHPILDKPVKLNKIIVKTPQDVGGGVGRRGLRSIIGEEHSWEAHIKYYLCYLYDNKDLWPSAIHSVNQSAIKVKVDSTKLPSEIFEVIEKRFSDLVSKYVPILMQEIPTVRFIALDLEVEAPPNKLPDFRTPKDRVLSVSLVWHEKETNDFNGEVHLLGISKKGSELTLEDIEVEETTDGVIKGFININQKKIRAYVYKSEKLMIAEVFKRLWTVPILVTFNGDNFDLNYLYARAEQLGIESKLIPFTVKRTVELTIAELKRGVHIDLYKFFSNGAIKTYVFKDVYETVSLDELSRVLLGERKLYLAVDFEKMTLGEIAKYNWWDAYLTARLFTFSDWLPWRIMLILSRITRYPIRDLSRRGVSSWISNWFYSEIRERNWLIPNEKDLESKKELANIAPRPSPVTKGKKYRGAIVFRPKAGVWFNVYVLDFASIYPTIIKVHNISFETVLCPHKDCRTNKISDLNYWICTKKEGLASALVGFIRDLRVNYYKKIARREKDPALKTLYSAIESALKVLINASYGVFGAENFSLYFLPVAESITAIGRQKILAVAEKAKELHLDVIYGDTDSIFIHNPSDDLINKLIDWVSRELKVDLEVDKQYVFVAFSSRKKNYFGLLTDKNIDIKGLLGKKRNTPEFLKNEFANVLELLRTVRTQEDMDRVKERIGEHIISIYRKLMNGDYNLEDLAFRVMVSKPIEKYTKTTPEHVKAARKLRRQVFPGEIISYVKCKDGPWPVETLKEDKQWRRRVDLEKYFEFTRSVFDQLLDALGMKIEDLEKKARGLTEISSFLG
ncbi:MAG: DNA-directed DNA polymerase I [Crenarchaeota archaeon]|nr:DNA-directed DNA polymerase I [Thermoproteota archaeon]MCR8500792.1 DNA-directed DNA polymerase I [Thermoproteota archaeon]